MSSPMPYLVVSASGRALAASARLADLSVVVLDLFNDVDTRRLAVKSERCAAARGGFSARLLLERAHALSEPDGFAGIVVGSGLEGRTRLHSQLARVGPLTGNSPECVARVKAPKSFFGMLDQVGVPHPAVSVSSPQGSDGWLSKRIGGAGGSHVRPARFAASHGNGRYFQRLVQGTAMSVLFLADGLGTEVLGFNRLISVRLSASQPFVFAGAVSEPEPCQALLEQISGIVADLTRELSLRGVNGLDFIQTPEGPQIIELNPRPTASMALHEGRSTNGLFKAHVEACAGRMPELNPPQPSRSRAMAIAWTRTSLYVPDGVAWPEWATDIPAPGSIIGARRPLCTVYGEAGSTGAAEQLVQERARTVIEQLRLVTA